MRTFVLGDIHGAYKALTQCIDRSGINKSTDQLIVLGDIVDGWHEIPECVDLLLEFKSLLIVRGNHDQWFMDFVKTGNRNFAWVSQGGSATLFRYEFDKDLMLRHYNDFFSKSKIYYIDKSRNYAFMHGGYDWHIPLDKNSDDDIMWDRHLLETAHLWHNYNINHGENHYFKEFDKIFVGHTTTEHTFSKKIPGSLEPAFPCNVVNLDTGAGWTGKLTIMDIDSLEYWQSDLVQELYKGVRRF